MSGSTPFGRGAVELFQDFNNSLENPKPYIFPEPSQDYSDAVARRGVLQDKRAAANPFRSQSEEEYLKNVASYEDEKNNLNLRANPMVEKENNNFLKQSYTPPTPVEMYDPENPFVVPRDKPAFPLMQDQSDIIIPRDKSTPPTREGEERGNIFQRLGTALSDENVRDKLIMGLQSLKADPNKVQIAMANERLKGRKTATQRNRTAEYIMQLTGDESMAKAVADGSIAPKDAINMYQSGVQKEKASLAKKSQYETILRDTNSPLLAQQVLEGGRSMENALEVGEKANLVMKTARDTEELVDNILNSSSFNAVFGMVEGRLPTLAEDTAYVEQLIFQLGSQQFLEAFAALRGGGQISNVEGAKATAARNALFDSEGEIRANISEKEARAELNKIIASVRRASQEQTDRYGIQNIYSKQTPINKGQTSQGVEWSFN